jgi:hypothetical protein
LSEWTAADLPSFFGRTVIVTGANTGLGLATARELARVGAKTILAVRNTTKGDEAAATMTGDVEVRKLDLQDLASVRAFADGVDGVDVLINNAGIMAVPYAQTVDGFESQIGTNHLGHFALTNPGYTATNLQGHTGSRIGDPLMRLGNKLATDANFGARQTLYAVSQELPGNSFIGPRFAMRGPTGHSARGPLARDHKKATALWELSEQLTDTKFAL